MVFLCAIKKAHKKSIGATARANIANPLARGRSISTMMKAGMVEMAKITVAPSAMGTAGAIVAPATPDAARRSFGRAARKAFERIARRRPHYGLTEFETAMTEALDQLRRGLHPDRGEDVAAVEAGIALLGAGRELIRVRDDGRPTAATIEVGGDVVRFLAGKERPAFDRARRAAQDAAAACLADLRDDKLGVAEARAAAREMVASAAIRDELERSGELSLDERAKGALAHVA